MSYQCLAGVSMCCGDSWGLHIQFEVFILTSFGVAELGILLLTCPAFLS